MPTIRMDRSAAIESKTMEGDDSISQFGSSRTSSSAAAGGGTKRERASLPWVEKYRPKGLGDLIAHQHIISTSKHQRFWASDHDSDSRFSA